MHVRELKEKDLNNFLNGLKQSAIENGIGDRFLQNEHSLHHAIFNEKHAFGLVAEINGNLAGYLLYSITKRNFTLHKTDGLYIHSLYVEVPFRRQKVGTQLVETLSNVAKKNDFGRIEFALLRNNQGGELFLESLSFEEIDFIKPMRLTITTATK